MAQTSLRSPMFKTVLVLMGLLLVATGIAEATICTIYASPSGASAGPCDSSSPCLIPTALNQCSEGEDVVLYLSPGEYVNSDALTPPVFNSLSILPSVPDAVVAWVCDEKCLNIQVSRQLTVQGLDVRGGSSYAIGVQVATANNPSVLMSNCTFSQGSSGVQFVGSFNSIDLTSVTFNGVVASSNGAAVNLAGVASSVSLQSCKFNGCAVNIPVTSSTSNLFAGGVVFLQGVSNVTVGLTEFTNNRVTVAPGTQAASTFIGGALYLLNCDLVIVDQSTFTDNTLTGDSVTAIGSSDLMEDANHLTGAAIAYFATDMGTSAPSSQSIVTTSCVFSRNAISAQNSRMKHQAASSEVTANIAGGAALGIVVSQQQMSLFQVTLSGSYFLQNVAMLGQSVSDGGHNILGGGALLAALSSSVRATATFDVVGCTFADNYLNATRCQAQMTNLNGGGAMLLGALSANNSVKIASTFSGCQFARNVAHVGHAVSRTVDSTGNFGGGAGVAIFLASPFSNANTSIAVSDSVFTDHVLHAPYSRSEGTQGNNIGGGVFAFMSLSWVKRAAIDFQMSNSIFNNNSVYTDNCVATDNGDSNGGGAIMAMALGNILSSVSQSLYNCSFTNGVVMSRYTSSTNITTNGGSATMVYAGNILNSLGNDVETTVVSNITRCVFTNNYVDSQNSSSLGDTLNGATVFLISNANIRSTVQSTISDSMFADNIVDNSYSSVVDGSNQSGGAGLYIYTAGVEAVLTSDVTATSFVNNVAREDNSNCTNSDMNGSKTGGAGVYITLNSEKTRTVNGSVTFRANFDSVSFIGNQVSANNALVTNTESNSGGAAAFISVFGSNEVTANVTMTNCTMLNQAVTANNNVVVGSLVEANSGGALYVDVESSLASATVNLVAKNCTFQGNTVSAANTSSVLIFNGGGAMSIHAQTIQGTSLIDIDVDSSTFIANVVDTPFATANGSSSAIAAGGAHIMLQAPTGAGSSVIRGSLTNSTFVGGRVNSLFASSNGEAGNSPGGAAFSAILPITGYTGQSLLVENSASNFNLSIVDCVFDSNVVDASNSRSGALGNNPAGAISIQTATAYSSDFLLNVTGTRFLHNELIANNQLGSTFGNAILGGAIYCNIVAQEICNTMVIIDECVFDDNVVSASNCVAPGHQNNLGGSALGIIAVSNGTSHANNVETLITNSVFTGNSVTALSNTAVEGRIEIAGEIYLYAVGESYSAYQSTVLKNCTFQDTQVIGDYSHSNGSTIVAGSLYAVAKSRGLSSARVTVIANDCTSEDSLLSATGVVVDDTTTIGDGSGAANLIVAGNLLFAYADCSNSSSTASARALISNTTVSSNRVRAVNSSASDNVFVGGTVSVLSTGNEDAYSKIIAIDSIFNSSYVHAEGATCNGSANIGGQLFSVSLAMKYSSSNISMESCNGFNNSLLSFNNQPEIVALQGGTVAFVVTRTLDIGPSNGTLYVSNCNFVQNSAQVEATESYYDLDGGVLYTIANSLSDTNVQVNISGVNMIGNSFTILNVPPYNTYYGGMIFASSTVSQEPQIQMTVRDSYFAGNRQYGVGSSLPLEIYEGGVINVVQLSEEYDEELSAVYVTNCQFVDNIAPNATGSAVSIQADAAFISNCTFTGNIGASGTLALNADWGQSVLSNSTFVNNIVSDSGAAVFTQSTLNLTSITVANCTALNGAGGGIASVGLVSIVGSDLGFTNNYASHGGAVFSADSQFMLTNCNFDGNMAADKGGAISLQNVASLSCSSCSFINHAAFSGGAASLDAYASIDLDDAVMQNNMARVRGGDLTLASRGHARITNSVVSNSFAVYSGGSVHIRDQSTVSMTNVTMYNLTAYESGAVLATEDKSRYHLKNISATLGSAKMGAALLGRDMTRGTVESSVFRLFSAGVEGGFLLLQNDATCSLISSEIADNTVSSTGNGGGALVVLENSVLSIVNSNVHHNQAPIGGAGYFDNLARVTISNTQVTNNIATNNGGGAFWIGNTYTFINNGSSISQNVASRGGAIYIAQAALAVNPCGVSIDVTSTVSNNQATGVCTDDLTTCDGYGNGGGLFYDSDTPAYLAAAKDCYMTAWGSGSQIYGNAARGTGADVSSSPVSIMPVNSSLTAIPGIWSTAEFYLQDMFDLQLRGYSRQTFQLDVGYMNNKSRTTDSQSNDGMILFGFVTNLEGPLQMPIRVKSFGFNLPAVQQNAFISNCPAGTFYTDPQGLNGICSTCPSGSYSFGFTTCTACRPDCSPTDDSCIDTEHLSCPGGNEVLIEPNCWVDQGSRYIDHPKMEPVLCPYNFCAFFPNNSIIPQRQVLTSTTTIMCAPNRDPTSYLCGECMPGYYDWDSECKSNDGSPNGSVIAKTVFTILGFTCLEFVFSQGSSIVAMRMLTFLYQTIGYIAYPDTNIMQISRLVKLIGGIPTEEAPFPIAGWNIVAARFVIAFLNFVMLFVILLIHMLLNFILGCRRDWAISKAVKAYLIPAVYLRTAASMILVFIGSALEILATIAFSCTHVIGNVSVLFLIPSITCTPWDTPSIICCVLIGALLLALFITIYRMRSYFATWQSMDPVDIQHLSTTVGTRQEELRRYSWAPFYAGYRLSYWAAIEVTHRLAFPAMFLVCVITSSRIPIFVLCFVALFVYYFAKPFHKQRFVLMDMFAEFRENVQELDDIGFSLNGDPAAVSSPVRAVVGARNIFLVIIQHALHPSTMEYCTLMSQILIAGLFLAAEIAGPDSDGIQLKWAYGVFAVMAAYLGGVIVANMFVRLGRKVIDFLRSRTCCDGGNNDGDDKYSVYEPTHVYQKQIDENTHLYRRYVTGL